MSRLMWGILAVAVLGGLAVLLLFGQPGSNGKVAVSEQEPAAVAEATPGPAPESFEPPNPPEETGAPDGSAGTHSSDVEGLDDEGSQGGVIVDGRIAVGEYTTSIEVAGVVVFWEHDGEHLLVGVVSPGAGYVSVGFDPVRRMEGANFILGAVDNGEVVMRDDVGTGPLTHHADIDREGSDDVLEAAGVQTEAGTTIEFVIPLDSGDPQDKVLVPGQSYTVLVAYHESDDSFLARHSERGTGEIILAPEAVP